MALLVKQVPSAGGAIATAAAAAGAGGDTFANSGVEFFYIKNGDSAPHSATFVANAGGASGAGGAQCSFGIAGTPAHDLTVSVDAGVEKQVGPFPVNRFNDSAGIVHVTYTAVTSVTVQVRAMS
jgi:hypothetical protein